MRSKMLIYSAAVASVGLFVLFDVLHDPTHSLVEAQNSIERDLSNANTQQKTSKYYGLKRAQVTLEEHAKNVRETKPGCNCGGQIEKYTQGDHSQWCTMFASWVALQAGTPVHSDKTNSWRITNSRDFAEYLQKNGTWHSRDEMVKKHLKPQVGDFIVFYRKDYESRLGHVDILIANGDKIGTGDTIGGNLLDQVYYHHDLDYLNSYYPMLGFGHPEK